MGETLVSGAGVFISKVKGMLVATSRLDGMVVYLDDCKVSAPCWEQWQLLGEWWLLS